MKDYFNKNLFKYNRRTSIPVKIGNIEMGGNNPIRIQSMTTTDTMDTNATVNQSIRMINAGCELVRVTAPSIKDAKNLKNIKDEKIPTIVKNQRVFGLDFHLLDLETIKEISEN